ncbi:hypothetical protein C9098_14830 [Escherichia coli]|nr:hypothetical protein C9098_14830 [Escherichia coli]
MKFESGLRTTSYANRVAQGRLFLCLKLPISVQYIALSERPFSVLRFVAGGLKYALAVSVSATRNDPISFPLTASA